MTPFNCELNGAGGICLLGDVYSRGYDSCLANCRGGEDAVGRNVNGANCDVNDAEAANCRTSPCFAQQTYGALYYVNDPLFISGRGVIRYFSVVVRDIGRQRGEASQVAGGNFRSLVLGEARRYL